MTGIDPAELATHPFLRGIPVGRIAALARACAPVTVPKGHRFFDEGDDARRFWLIRNGEVALDIHRPGHERLIVETLGQGELLGLSWLAPPFQWQFGALVVMQTTAYELDGGAVLAACELDPGLGYQLLRRAIAAASRRLQATRVRMLDLYALPARERP